MTNTYDTLNFGTVFDKARNALGRRLFVGKTTYVVNEMKEAVESQKEAIREATGISVDPIMAAYRAAGIEVVTIGAPRIEDGEDGLDAYNAGWLVAFFHGLAQAEQDAENGIWFTGTREDYLNSFLQKEKYFFYQKWSANPTQFNKGAHESYVNWIELISIGWQHM